MNDLFAETFDGTRRSFLTTGLAAGAWAAFNHLHDAKNPLLADETKSPSPHPAVGRVVLNDDGYVFLLLSDDLTKDDLLRYLKSYCHPGVDTIAYCVGDMSWPTFHPTKIGVHYKTVPPVNEIRQMRIHRNLDRLEAEPGGYFGSVFSLIHGLGKQVLASFRMNDAHFTSADNPNVSDFWKQQSKWALGPVYGYYGGCLNYERAEVRQHIFDRIAEFVSLYPEVDGVELDCMRSPYFFPPEKGPASAPLFTELVRKIKSLLATQARTLNRPDYRLTINVPLTPELALNSGLDVLAWDQEGLFDAINTGTYNASMNHPLELWKRTLSHGTPILAYIGCSPNDGQYLGLEEYRAAAANAWGGKADGVYLFNYPCLFELEMQRPSDVALIPSRLSDLTANGQRDFSRVAQALEEMGSPEVLRGKQKHYLFYPTRELRYRHHDSDQAFWDRTAKENRLVARFRCYETESQVQSLTLKFKLENTLRSERFALQLNGTPINESQIKLSYAANGRDTRMHTITLGPYLEYEVQVDRNQLKSGLNELSVTPLTLVPGLTHKIHFLELELWTNEA